MNIFWFRRDLRIEDNAGLFHALKEGKTRCIFIFDTTILEKLEDKSDKRVNLIYNAIEEINKGFKPYKSSVEVFYGQPLDVWKKLLETNEINKIYFNKDYEPYGIERDRELVELWNSKGIPHYKFLDHLIFKPNEVLKSDGTPYSIYTPYSKKWKEKFQNYLLPEYPSQDYLHHLEPCSEALLPIESYGFQSRKVELQKVEIDLEYLKNYPKNRDIPSLNHTSHLSVYLRFGFVSIRKVVDEVKNEEKFLNELIWREFYMQILFHYPQTVVQSFKPAYDKIVWSTNMAQFESWCRGETGFPIVDAGMRELNATGLMHNRLRMICSSFLVKNLWIDWRLGEAYFASKLLDYELSSNVGGWQWAASSGCDAAPYFRIFNPELQQQKFDHNMEYLRRWVPEYGTELYPRPIVDYKESKDAAITNFKKYLA